MDVEVTNGCISKNRLKTVLRAKRLSQEGCAQRAGLSLGYFNRILLNKVDPTYTAAWKIATVLGTTPMKLFTLKLETRAARPRAA